MKTEICKRLGIEFPIFAFSHCRDVVAAVSNAGGFGVLGAVGFSADQLRVELDWLDEHVAGGYGVDIVIPGKYVGMGEMDVEKLQALLAAQIPAEHRAFAKKLLADHDVPELPGEEKPRELLGWTEATAGLQVEVALEHPKVKAFANALGTPPADVIKEIQSTGRLVGALCGSAKQALSHKEAGIDFIIAQGTEGGGHVGWVTSMVLTPMVVDAVAPIPVLTAGGVADGRGLAAAIALGADGVLLGTRFLATVESPLHPNFKQAIVDCDGHDTALSEIPDIAAGEVWPGAMSRSRRNRFIERWAGREWLLRSRQAEARASIQAARKAGDINEAPLSMGQDAGLIKDIPAAGEIVRRIAEEAAAILSKRLPKVMQN
jgi:NAD(P)H-dependent flavin oxidoreductase YrpB (nitropropane dioxygenase family)